jgi:hypothetical protein
MLDSHCDGMLSSVFYYPSWFWSLELHTVTHYILLSVEVSSLFARCSACKDRFVSRKTILTGRVSATREVTPIANQRAPLAPLSRSVNGSLSQLHDIGHDHRHLRASSH